MRNGTIAELVEKALSHPRVKCREMQQIVERLAPGCSYRRKSKSPASMKFILGPDGTIRHKAQANKDLLVSLLEETTDPTLDRLKPKRLSPEDHIREEKAQAEAKIHEIISDLQNKVGGQVCAIVKDGEVCLKVAVMKVL